MNVKQPVKEGSLVKLRKQGMFDGKVGRAIRLTVRGSAVVKFDGINHGQIINVEELEVVE